MRRFVAILLICTASGTSASLRPVITAPHGISGERVAISVTFEDRGTPIPVTGFSAEDVTIDGGTLSDFAGTGHTYTFMVTPIKRPAAFAVTIAADAADSSFTIARGVGPFASWPRVMQISFPGYTGKRLPLRNVPVLLRLDAASGFGAPTIKGGDVPWADLRLTAADMTTELDYEVESWDAQGGLVWVKLPKLAADTVIYAFWGKAGETAAAANPAAVWTEGYVGVWHMNEAGAPRDHAGGGHHGTVVGDGVTFRQNGKVGNAITTTQRGGNGGIKVVDRDSLDFADGSFTVEMWVRKDAGSTGWSNIGEFGKWNHGGQPSTNEWSLGTTAAGNDNRPGFSIEVGNVTHKAVAEQPISVGDWNHLVGVRDGTAMRLYLNGREAAAMDGVAGPTNNVGCDLHFGYFPGRPELSVRAGLDEYRISDVARSADWIYAAYGTVADAAFARYRVPTAGQSSEAASASFEQHWAYERPLRSAVPTVDDPAWQRHPIDAFVLARMQANGLKPNPPAAPATWLRRVTLDLTGLPPTLAELDAFLGSVREGNVADVREQVVDRLLASPHFGERWAQPWLDAARYGDSTGLHEDEIHPTWPYRDWVIKALNEDMPFDQFTIEQLAGDMLPSPTTEQRLATGFHRAAPFNTEGGTPKEARRAAQVIDRVNVTGTVWLGTTLECAQCHDHNYDPIRQEDYYAFFAIFNNTPDEMGPSVGPGRNQMAGPRLQVAGTSTFVMQEMQRHRRTHIFRRGNYETPGEAVSARLLTALHRPARELPANRLGLAQWLVDPANPLTPRVTVNRWWAELFGAGLVTSVNDFGKTGQQPSHPALLDWLAVEFVESGWRMKHMLKLMVLSRAYGQSARVTEGHAADALNRWLSRSSRRRLPAENIRDNALAIAGILSPAVGGPPAYPPQPDDIWWIRDDKSPKYVESHGEDRYRRGVYTIWRRTYLHPSLAAFDAPGRDTCVVARERTNTPLQALTLLNDPIYTEAAFALARKLYGMQEADGARIAHAFRLATARTIESAESETLLALLNSRRQRFAADATAAARLVESVRGDLVAGVSPLDHQALAELAAWFHVANAILNLDEVITKG